MKRSRERKGGGEGAENQSSIVRIPGKIHRRFKGGVARLASEYEGIKSALRVWPDQKRVCRSLTAQSHAE